MSSGESFPNLHGQLDVTDLSFQILDAPSWFSVCSPSFSYYILRTYIQQHSFSFYLNGYILMLLASLCIMCIFSFWVLRFGWILTWRILFHWWYLYDAQIHSWFSNNFSASTCRFISNRMCCWLSFFFFVEGENIYYSFYFNKNAHLELEFVAYSYACPNFFVHIFSG